MLYHLTLLLPCTVCLFGAALILLKINSNTIAQNILSLCFLLSAVFFFCTANYMAGVNDYAAYMRMDIIDSFVTLLVIPTMYLYFRSSTHEEPFTWKDYIWFLPAFVVGIGTCVLYLAMDKTEVIGYIQTVLIDRTPTTAYSGAIYRMHGLISVTLYNLTALVQIVGAGTCAVVNLRKYHHRLREFYSDVDDKSMDTDNKMLFWFMLTIPLAVGIILPKRTFWEQHPFFASFYFIAWAAVYFGMLYYDSQKKYTVENLAHDLRQADSDAARNDCDPSDEDSCEDKEEDTTTQTNKYAKYLTAFRQLIEEDRLFLQSNLRADELASRIHTNRTYLSRMIKAEYQCTFSEYINRKRVEYSQQLMRENPDMKLVTLAEKSGFTNINTYGRTFKQMIGVSPGEWLKSSHTKA